MADITLYHGSERLIPVSYLGGGNANNDYGSGFYCTRRFDLAGEWACKRGKDGYVNEYVLHVGKLRVLDLMCGDFTVLNWVALLLANRTFTPRTRIGRANKQFLIENCLPDTTGFDVVVGYRADDSYFSYAEDFVNNNLSVGDLARALKLGNLGLQTVLISERAFSCLEFVQASHVDANEYEPRYSSRESSACSAYADDCGEYGDDLDGLIATDFARGGVGVDDARVPRMLS